MTAHPVNPVSAPLSPAYAALRQAFKYGNKFMLLMWRLGLQRWGMSNPYLGYIMGLTHTGRKSGLQRRTPINFRPEWADDRRATSGGHGTPQRCRRAA